MSHTQHTRDRVTHTILNTDPRFGRLYTMRRRRAFQKRIIGAILVILWLIALVALLLHVGVMHADAQSTNLRTTLELLETGETVKTFLLERLGLVCVLVGDPYTTALDCVPLVETNWNLGAK